MSHFVERKENNCLNCGAVVYGRYCHVCGQENVEPKETFWHLVTHFVYDITHFDGKFFSTVKYLLFKPGFLSHEYIIGRRMRYLNPIKMYVFVSAFFFLFFFSIVKPSVENKKETEQLNYQDVRAEIEERIKQLKSDINDKDNPESARKIMENQLQLFQEDLRSLAKDTTNLSDLNYNKEKEINSAFKKYKDLATYDSAQKSLPLQERDNWLKRMVVRKAIQLQLKYKEDNTELFKALFERFRHSFPQLFFVSLPVFALLLKLLYIRKKNFYYVDHVIYSVHLYCAMFILLFIVLSISQIEHFRYLQWLHYFTVPLILYIIWYQYKSLRNFYDQRRSKTILKYLLLLIMSLAVMSVLFIAFLVLSVLNL